MVMEDVEDEYNFKKSKAQKHARLHYRKRVTAIRIKKKAFLLTKKHIES